MSGWISIHELRSVGSREFLNSSGLCGVAFQEFGSGETESNDENSARFDESAARECRSENACWHVALDLFIHDRHRLAPLRHDRGGMLNGFNDRDVGSAAAEIGRRTGVGEGVLDLRKAGIGIAFEEFGGLDHHAVLAKSALWSLLFDPGLLDGMKRIFRLLRRQALLLGPARGQTFERGDLFIGDAGDRRYAGARFFAVDQDGTSAALGESAAELRTDQLEIVTQDVKQRSIVRRLHLAPDSVHIQCDHTELPPTAVSESGRLLLKTPMSRGTQ